MADATITVDIRTSLPDIKQAVSQVDGLKNMLNGLERLVSKGFSKDNVLAFGKSSILAAQAAGAYTGQVDALAGAVQTLQVAVGSALLPVLDAVAPGVEMAVQALSRLAFIFAQVMGQLFGGGQTAAKGGDKAAKATAKLAVSTAKAGKEAKGLLASFDELNVLEDTSVAGVEGPSASAEVGLDLSGTERAADEIVLKFQTAADSIQTYFDTELSGSVHGAIESIALGAAGLIPTFQGVWGSIVGLGEPLKMWFNESFTPYLQTWITTWGGVLGGLLDTFNLVFSDIWNLSIAPTLEKWAIDILPLLTNIGTECLLTLGVLFDNVKLLFDTFWSEGIAPVLGLIQTIWAGLWDGMTAAWEEHGKPIFDGIRELIGNVADTLLNAWETIAKPVLDTFVEVVTRLWNDHLKPLWNHLLDFIGSFAEMALTAFNDFILPIVNWLIDLFGPAFAKVFGGILEVVGGVIGGIADFISGLLEKLTGVVDFLTNVFAGNWEAAWQRLIDIFKGIFNTLAGVVKGAVNLVIDVVNGLISAVVTAINTVIRGINSISIDVPDNPITGPLRLGFDIPTFKAPQIPRLATGAVIPPNRAFMAVLGDQRSGNNIETPEGLLRQIFREESGSAGVVAELREILAAVREGQVLMVDKRVLGRAVQSTLADHARAGGAVPVPVR